MNPSVTVPLPHTITTPNDRWVQMASPDRLEKTVAALRANGHEAHVVPDGVRAREKVLGLIPAGAEVFTVSSVTLDLLGLTHDINGTDRYVSVRNRVKQHAEAGDRLKARQEAGATEWTLGSVHAITEQGEIVVTSASGSQLAPYAYGSANVVLVVGTQKLVADLGEALQRIRERALPLETERFQRLYGRPSGANKTLILQREILPGRIKVVLVEQVLGF